jgi:hypothetical protein
MPALRSRARYDELVRGLQNLIKAFEMQAVPEA